MKHIGFTGTRNEPTHIQLTLLRQFLENKKKYGAQVFHHGNCIGADTVAAFIADELDYYIVCHPAESPRYEGVSPYDEKIERYPYLERNTHIVQSTNLLVSIPYREVTLEEILNCENGTRRGGTYYTTRYALKHEKWVYMITPSGCIQYGIHLSPDKVEYRLWLNPSKI
jgi:hypothetical protein